MPKAPDGVVDQIAMSVKSHPFRTSLPNERMSLIIRVTSFLGGITCRAKRHPATFWILVVTSMRWAASGVGQTCAGIHSHAALASLYSRQGMSWRPPLTG